MTIVSTGRLVIFTLAAPGALKVLNAVQNSYTTYMAMGPLFVSRQLRRRKMSSVLLSVFSLRFSAYLRDLCVETAVNPENAEVRREPQRYAEKIRHHRITTKTQRHKNKQNKFALFVSW